MKIKLILFTWMLLSLSVCFADRVSKGLTEIVKNLSLSDSIEVISFHNNRYIVSVADADINSNAPIDKLNALKVAKQKSEMHLSLFINGEDVYISERLSSIRVIKTDTFQSKSIKNKDIYNEFIRSKSNGAIRNMKNIKWVSGDVYYVATLLKI